MASYHSCRCDSICHSVCPPGRAAALPVHRADSVPDIRMRISAMHPPMLRIGIGDSVASAELRSAWLPHEVIPSSVCRTERGTDRLSSSERVLLVVKSGYSYSSRVEHTSRE